MSDKKWKRNRRRMSRKERKELAKCIWFEELADFDGAVAAQGSKWPDPQAGRLPTGPSPLEMTFGIKAVMHGGMSKNGKKPGKEGGDR